MDERPESGGIPGWLWSAALVVLVLIVTAFLLRRG